jgi:hypothetical protein
VSSAVAREVEWYREMVAGLAPLEAPAGPFYRVTSELSELAQGRNQLYLALVSQLDASADKDGRRRIDHEISALVLWAVGPAGRAHVSEATLDDAVDAVVQRVRGVPEAPNHGGRWWMVGPTSVEFPPPAQLLANGDAILAAGAADVRSVRYTVTSWQ